MSTKIFSIVALVSTLTLSTPAFAGWSLGLGYHNPPNATVGVNFMHLWTNWAFEIGIGYIGKTESWNKDKDGNTTQDANYSVAGDLNLKYLFLNGTFRPYLVGGFGAGIATSSKGSVSAGASVSHPFGGGGFFIMGQSAYFYLGALVLNAFEGQAGVGFTF